MGLVTEHVLDRTISNCLHKEMAFLFMRIFISYSYSRSYGGNEGNANECALRTCTRNKPSSRHNTRQRLTHNTCFFACGRRYSLSFAHVFITRLFTRWRPSSHQHIVTLSPITGRSDVARSAPCTPGVSLDVRLAKHPRTTNLFSGVMQSIDRSFTAIINVILHLPLTPKAQCRTPLGRRNVQFPPLGSSSHSLSPKRLQQ